MAARTSNRHWGAAADSERKPAKPDALPAEQSLKMIAGRVQQPVPAVEQAGAVPGVPFPELAQSLHYIHSFRLHIRDLRTHAHMLGDTDLFLILEYRCPKDTDRHYSPSA